MLCNVMHSDERGLATGLLGFAAMLVVAALVYTLLDPAAVSLFDMASGQTSNARAQDAIALRRQIWDAVLYFVLFLASVFIIARAVLESRGPT